MILLLAFGALVAAAVPLLLALTAVAAKSWAVTSRPLTATTSLAGTMA